MNDNKKDRVTIVLALIAITISIIAIDPEILKNLNILNNILLKYSLYLSAFFGGLYVFSYALSLTSNSSFDIGDFKSEEIQDILYKLSLYIPIIFISSNIFLICLTKVGINNQALQGGLIGVFIGALKGYKLILNMLTFFIRLLGKIFIKNK